MRRVMDGETVYVAVRDDGAKDRLGNPMDAWAEPVPVHRVLVGASTDDERSGTRQDGISSTVTLTFPRTCSLDMRGAKVVVRGRELRVIGDPMHEPSPLPWDMTVRAGVSDG